MNNNLTFTENGATTYKSTLNAIADLFALGGAYRKRTEGDCILLFSDALKENETLAIKCLFYLRDILEGQGERRFFRVCAKWLANNHTEAIRRNLPYIASFGRWDDYYIFVGTPLEKDAFAIMKHQLALDVQTKTPSLLAKWLKSENTSSHSSRALAKLTRQYFNMTSKQYRKTLALLRERIKVLEKLMSANRWNEIEFDKIPSKAGSNYRKAFEQHDFERYQNFIMNKKTKVNAKTLYPYEVVQKALQFDIYHNNDIERTSINKYWENLTDYFNNAKLNALCVIDTSGSMWGNPLEVAISLGLYAAERAKGPFANHYISFSSKPQLIETKGIDFVDKVLRIQKENLCENTNIEATFDLILQNALTYNLSQNDLPEKLIIISDMEFDSARMEFDFARGGYCQKNAPRESLIETIENKWNSVGYKMPSLIFWNVDARNNNIPMAMKDGITFVSGFSPITFEMIMQNKTSIDFILDKLNSERYSCIS